MTIKEKIQLYLDLKGINTNEFERSIGVSKSYWRNTKNISAEILAEIIRIYSDINMEWLLTGRGNMFKGYVPSSNPEPLQPAPAAEPLQESAESYLMRNTLSIRKRINDILKLKKTTIPMLCKQLSMPQKTLHGQLQGNAPLPLETLLSLTHIHKDISLEWLLTGKGSGLHSQSILPAVKSIEETRPRISMNAAAGAISTALSGVTQEECEQLPVIQAFARYNYTLFVKGDSMEPEFHSGDELACLQVTNFHFIQWGRYHVLDTSQGVVVKRIYEEGEYIICKSEESTLYPDFRIHKNDVYNIALVIGMIRRY